MTATAAAGRSKLLVAVNFDSASIRALDLAKELAGPLEAEVILVHVYRPPHFVYPTVPVASLARLYNRGETAARRAIDDLAARSGNLRAILRHGDPASEILGAIDEVHPMLVLMGTHGRHGVERALLGSEAEYVLRHASVPVLTVRAVT